MLRAAIAATLLSAVLLAELRCTGLSDAVFTATKANPGNTFSSGTLAPPTAVTATPAGRNVSVGFTAAASATGTQILYGRPASGSTCTGVTLSVAQTAASSPAVHTPSAAPQGTFACYTARSVRSSWTSLTTPAPVAVRTGVVVTSVVATAAANTAGCADGSWQPGRLDCGDRFVLTFNQPIDPATGPGTNARVCASATYGVRLGASATTTDCAAEGAVGRISGASVSRFARYATIHTWNAARTQLTVDVRGVEAGQAATVTAVDGPAFNPTTDATKLRSAVGAAHVCDTNTGGCDCLPEVTGSV